MTNQGDATAKRSENALFAATIVKSSAIECSESSRYIKKYTIVHEFIINLYPSHSYSYKLVKILVVKRLTRLVSSFIKVINTIIAQRTCT